MEGAWSKYRVTLHVSGSSHSDGKYVKVHGKSRVNQSDGIDCFQKHSHGDLQDDLDQVDLKI